MPSRVCVGSVWNWCQLDEGEGVRRREGVREREFEYERERERGPGGGGSITTAGGATECHALRPHSTLLARHDTTKRGLVTLTEFSHGYHRARRSFQGLDSS